MAVAVGITDVALVLAQDMTESECVMVSIVETMVTVAIIVRSQGVV